MRRLLLLLLAVAQFAGCTVYGFPPAVNPRSPGPGDLLDAGAVILEDVATLEYRVMNLPEARGPRLVAVLDHRRRYKILHDSGLAVADVELPIDGYTTVTRVIGRSVSARGREQTMSGAAVVTGPRSDPSERASDLRTARFHIPDAEVGGLVEYRYERVYVDPHLVPPWVFGDKYPVLRSEFGLIVSPKVKADYRYGHGERIIDRAPMVRSTDSGQERLMFVETELPAYFNEPLMNHPTRSMPWIAVSLHNEKLGDVPDRLETWEDVGALVLQRMLRVQGRALTGTVPQRFAAIRDKLHPVLLPGVGVRPPVNTGEQLLKGAPACSRDAASLVVQALNGSDATVVPALLTSPEGPAALFDFPALYPFVRVVAAMEMTPELRKDQDCDAEPLLQGPLCTAALGGYVFLDATCKTCAFGTLMPHLRGGKALIMGQETHWVDVPIDKPQHNVSLASFKWELDVAGVLKGSVEAEVRGTTAALVRAHLAAAEDDDDRTHVVQDAVLGEGKLNPALQSYKLTDATNIDQPLRISADAGVQAERQDYERFKVRAAMLVGTSIPKHWLGTRRTSALLDGPRWNETGAEVTLPVGYEAQIRPPLQLSKPYAEYAAGFALRGRALRFSRRLVLKTNSIRAEDWHDFQDFVTAIRDYEADGPLVYAPQ